MAKVWDCNILVAQLEIESNYYVPFWANTLEKRHDSS